MRREIAALLATTTLVAASVVSLASTHAQAATGLENFDAGYIISDDLMYGATAASSLSDEAIAAFLSDKGSQCHRGSDGTPCLKNAVFDVASLPANSWCVNAFEGGKKLNAATIIGRAARACQVSPKVLITILQKEQGLITTTEPTQSKYDKATGFACPDSVPCNTQYAGFVAQVYFAASRLQQYRLQPYSFRFRAGLTANIAWNPNANCGNTRISIKNAATAALYNYTPYVPNAAALKAVTGTGDACSTYGNRNFYRNYTLWFGQPNPGAQPNTPPVAEQPRDSEPAAPTSPPKSDATAPLLNSQQQVGNGWVASKTLGVGDWNSDGTADLMLMRSDGTLHFYRGRGNTGWISPIRVGVGWQTFSNLASGHDWNGDGRSDILAVHTASGRLYLYPGNGRGGFGAAKAIGQGWQGMTSLAIVPSWDGNRPALAAVTPTGQLRFYLGNGSGGFSGRKDFGYGWKSMRSLVGLPDRNGDGRGELIALTQDSRIRQYTSTRNGGLAAGATAQTNFLSIHGAGTYPDLLFAVDLRGGLQRLTLSRNF